MIAGNTIREVAGCLRPALELAFGAVQDHPDYGIGLRAADRCAPLSPIGCELLRLHLSTTTMDTRGR